MSWYIHPTKQLRDDELPPELVVTNRNGSIEQVYVPYNASDQLQAENAKLHELIVRCCDCESAREHYEGMDVWWCEYLRMYVGSSDFCCWGKRREDA